MHPAGVGLAVVVRSSHRQAVEGRVVGEPTRDALEQQRGVDAVVVGERDDVGREAGQRNVARACQPRRGCEVQRVGMVRLEHRREAIVGVLVDDDQPEPAIGLGVERVEEAVELGDATERRQDQVERRKAGRHAP